MQERPQEGHCSKFKSDVEGASVFKDCCVGSTATLPELCFVLYYVIHHRCNKNASRDVPYVAFGSIRGNVYQFML